MKRFKTNGALKVLVTDYTGIPEMIAHRNGDLQTVSFWH
jgi:hypothetical protein